MKGLTDIPLTTQPATPAAPQRRSREPVTCNGCGRAGNARWMRSHKCRLAYRERCEAGARWYEAVKRNVYGDSKALRATKEWKELMEKRRRTRERIMRTAVLGALKGSSTPLSASEIALAGKLKQSFILGQLLRKMYGEKLIYPTTYKRWVLNTAASRKKWPGSEGASVRPAVPEKPASTKRSPTK